MTTDSALSIESLEAGYPDTTVLRDLNLEVAEGETLVVIGPNGHGKTTLLRAISGLATTRSGEIRLHGTDVTGMRTERMSELGLVHIPQGDMLFPGLTVEENLLMGSFPGESWKQRNVALKRVYELFPALVERSRSESRTLSGGERRQVAIGRGLMREARLYLIDEPSLGLAPVIVERVYEVIGEMSRTATVLLVEENFNHIETVADRVCVLEMGRIVKTGTVAELTSDKAVAESYLGVAGIGPEPTETEPGLD